MKVLLFIESGGPGGAEQVVLHLAKLLVAAGDEVLVATLRSGWFTQSLKEAGIPHAQVESKGRLDFTLPFRIAALIRREHCDVIHSHLLDSNFYAALAACIAGVPHVATEHGDVHHPDKKKFFRVKLWTLTHSGSTLTAVSENTANELRRLGADAVEVIGNPVSSSRLSPEIRRRIRQEMGLGEKADTFLWLNVGSLRPVKAQATLLEAFELSQHDNPTPQRLLILGEGPERNALEAMIQKSDLKKSACLLGFCQNVSDYLQAADGFVLSSKSEALPMAVLEAATFALPVVATRVGGLPEVIDSQSSGLLVSPENAAELSNAMKQVVGNIEKARQMGQALKASVESRFSEKAVVGKYHQLYQAVLAR